MSPARRKRKGPDLEGVKLKAGPRAVFAPDHLDIVRMIAMRGADDAEMARNFGVDTDTFAAWRELYTDFDNAIQKGRSKADQEVVVSLYRKATGYEYEEEVAVGGKEPEVMKVKRYAHPDFNSIQYWMNNRVEGWGTKSRAELTGAAGGPIGVKHETKIDIIDAIVNMLSPKPDGETNPASAKTREQRA